MNRYNSPSYSTKSSTGDKVLTALGVVVVIAMVYAFALAIGG